MASRLTEEVEVHVLLLFLFLNNLLLFLGCAGGGATCSWSCGGCAATASTEVLQLVLARLDDLSDVFALEFGDELVCDAGIELGLDGLEDLLDILGGWAFLACHHGHQVSATVFHGHGDESFEATLWTILAIM